MNNKGQHTIYFLGIGGIGMSALARYYRSQGVVVAGYDRTVSPLTQELEREGMAIHYEDNPKLLPALIDNVIYTPAVPSDLAEMEEIRRRGIPMMKRSQALGQISREHFCIAVAGTHGKTTTTAMVAHILRETGVDMTAFIGGIANNFGSNLHIGNSKEAVLVAEADEYDRSFLQLDPDLSIINAIDDDHLDIYGDHAHLEEGFEAFANLTHRRVLVREGLPIHGDKVRYFGFGEDADVRITEVSQQEGESDFIVVVEGGNAELTESYEIPVHLPLAGTHNILNATAAIAVVLELGLSGEEAAKALASFRGVKRRFDVRIKDANHCYIDDYAHHPEEIKSCLSAIRASFPTRKITLVFQPHLFTRTRDFMEDFARSLAMADDLILLDIYPARELPIEGITSQVLLEKVALDQKCLCSKEGLLELLDTKRPELLVTMGAGDIDRFVEPLEMMIQTW